MLCPCCISSNAEAQHEPEVLAMAVALEPPEPTKIDESTALPRLLDEHELTKEQAARKEVTQQTEPETVVIQPAKPETEPPEQQPRKDDETEQTFALGDQDRKRVDDFMACNNAPGWKPISNIFGPKTTKKFMLQQEGNPLVLIKGVSPVKCKAKRVYEFFSDASKWQESMKIADVMFVGGKVLTIYDAHHCAYFAKFKTPPGVINRDFCFEDFHSMLDENTAVTLAHSVERADCPPSDAHWSWVRGEIKVSGYMARDDTTGDGCELTYIVQVDPKGWLPSWVVNIVAADQADNVTRIAQYFKKTAA